jgi:hypothetical protein
MPSLEKEEERELSGVGGRDIHEKFKQAKEESGKEEEATVLLAGDRVALRYFDYSWGVSQGDLQGPQVPPVYSVCVPLNRRYKPPLDPGLV